MVNDTDLPLMFSRKWSDSCVKNSSLAGATLDRDHTVDRVWKRFTIILGIIGTSVHWIEFGGTIVILVGKIKIDW
jgi:hypothetical protein